jgi:hypothetical protein
VYLKGSIISTLGEHWRQGGSDLDLRGIAAGPAPTLMGKIRQMRLLLCPRKHGDAVAQGLQEPLVRACRPPGKGQNAPLVAAHFPDALASRRPNGYSLHPRRDGHGRGEHPETQLTLLCDQAMPLAEAVDLGLRKHLLGYPTHFLPCYGAFINRPRLPLTYLVTASGKIEHADMRLSRGNRIAITS